MKRDAQRKSWVVKLEGSICPRIMIKLGKYKEKARYWAGNGFYSVEHGAESFIVNLNQGSCTCKGWELSRIPCPHSLAVMREERLNPLTFVHDC